MMIAKWKKLPISRRIAILQWALPVFIVALVFAYQTYFVDYVHALWGHEGHYVVEIFFYGIFGPLATIVVLAWIRRWLTQKEEVERKLKEKESRLTTIQLEAGRHVAQHLHREVLPNLAFSANKIEHVRSKLPRDVLHQDGMDDGLQGISSTLRRTIASMRENIHLLRQGSLPHSLQPDTHLIDKLGPRIKQFEKLFGVCIALSYEGEQVQLPYELETALWRILGESLNNIALHAGAQTVDIKLDFSDPEQVLLDIIDDGQGFDRDRILSEGRGLGLVHIREEAAKYGATLVIDSAPGAGARITVAFPLPAHEDARG